MDQADEKKPPQGAAISSENFYRQAPGGPIYATPICPEDIDQATWDTARGLLGGGSFAGPMGEIATAAAAARLAKQSRLEQSQSGDQLPASEASDQTPGAQFSPAQQTHGDLTSEADQALIAALSAWLVSRKLLQG